MTSSNDFSVRLWTLSGDYIGTFGDKWVLASHPTKSSYALGIACIAGDAKADMQDSETGSDLGMKDGGKKKVKDGEENDDEENHSSTKVYVQ